MSRLPRKSAGSSAGSSRRFFGPGFVLALGLCLFAACGQTDGDSAHFPGTVTYDSPTGDFHLHLLEPPWLPIRLPTETFFAVPPSAVTLSVREDDALYSLHIYKQSTDATTAFTAQAQQQSPPWDVAQSQALAGGTTSGVDMSWTGGPNVFHRDAFVDDDLPGTSFRLHFTAKTSMAADPMISQIIASFQPWPSSAHTAHAGDGGAGAKH
ncbi:MAG TPA: hypothetical protein VFH73_16115 [Polyangia bacterium]|nr:hypothetical protein [Polyangia bacterium]